MIRRLAIASSVPSSRQRVNPQRSLNWRLRDWRFSDCNSPHSGTCLCRRIDAAQELQPLHRRRQRQATFGADRSCFNWSMRPQELRKRTKTFAIEIIRFCRALSKTEKCRVISVERLAEEAEELTRIFAASRETAKANAKTRGAKRLIT